LVATPDCIPVEKQFRWRNLKGCGKKANVFQTHIAFSTFHSTHVTAVKPDPKRKFFLAPSSNSTEFT